MKNKIESDVSHESARIATCEKDFHDNKCHDHQRVPLMKDQCEVLDKCRFENPRAVVMTSKAVTILVGNVINGLLTTLETKSLVVMFTFLFGYFLLFYLLE